MAGRLPNPFNPNDPTHVQALQALTQDYDRQAAELVAAQAAQREYQQLLGIVQDRDEALAHSLEKIEATLDIQSADQLVPKYSGEPRKLKGFLKQIEKVVKILFNPPYLVAQYRALVFRCSRGLVSDFVQRYCDNTPRATWNDIKDALIERFGEAVDSATLLARLKNLKQQDKQATQIFGEYLLSRSAEAFSEQELEGRVVQAELVAIFCKGLRNKQIARKVCEREPATLENAIALAREFDRKHNRLYAYGLAPQNSSSGFRTNHVPEARVEEDMEINMTSSAINAVTKTTQTGAKRHPYKDGKPICYGCRKVGHIIKNCPDKTTKKKGEQSSQKPKKQQLN